MDDLDAMVARKDELQEAVDTIKHQLEMAKAEYHETGQYSDAKWFAKASQALRCKQREVQKLVRKIAELRKDERISRSKDLGNAFIDAARENLSPEQFQRILQIAQGRVAAIGEDYDEEA